MRFRFTILLELLFSLVACCWMSAQARNVNGVVRDVTGGVVAGATVELQGAGQTQHTQTDSNGCFALQGIPTVSVIAVHASGFADANVALPAGETHPLIVLKLAPGSEEITVSAARTELRLSESPGSTVELSTTDLAATPALAIDDVLRQVPEFSLFRRNSSRTANPTTEGVSLRGLGASGASRALVLVNGITLLDPFGGWVYWDRVPRASLSSVEVFRGGSSSVYGSNAMGGIVQVRRRTPEGPSLVLEGTYGNENTPDLSLWTGTVHGPWSADIAADLFRSDGFILVPAAVRGAVDTAANSEHGTLDAGVDRKLGTSGDVFVRGNFFLESRNNGTPIQVNDTQIAFGTAGFDHRWNTGDALQLRIFGDAQTYNQNFSAIASDRNSESLTNMQHVPAQEAGGNAQWSRPLGHSHTLIAGADLIQVIGESDEQIFSSGTHFADNVAGGRQRTLGFFGEDVIRWNKWTIIPAARVDYWRNFNGRSIRTTLSSGEQTGGPFADRSETAFDPRLSVLRSINDKVSVTGSVYRAFRAPTLNELYRSFRQGNTLTENNADLVAERLTGEEAGAHVALLDHRLNFSGTFFWNDVVDPVANVTLSSTPSLITRQRQNLGRTRSLGLELDGTYRVSSYVDISAGYALVNATVVNFSAEPELVGLNVPQVPLNQFTVTGRYWNPGGWMLSAVGRFVGLQYDDDLNTLPLDRFFTVALFAGHEVHRGVTAFVAIENLTNERYVTALTPVPNLGPPILVRGGIRVVLGRDVR